MYSSDMNFRSECPTVLALGTFDGMHIAHREVVSRCVTAARKRGIPAAVWCFDAPPKDVMTLCTAEEKVEAMRAIGVDIIVCPPFSKTIKTMSAEDFFDKIIVGNMKAKAVVCGYNYTFGKGRSGNVSLLRDLCGKNDIELICVEQISYDGEAVSSTRIRKLITENKTEKADALLGR